MTVGVDAEGNPIVSDQPRSPFAWPRMEKLAVDPKHRPYPIQGKLDGLVEGKDYKWSYTVRYPVVKKDDDNKPLTDSKELLDPDVESSSLEDYWPVNDDGDKVGDTNPLAFAQIDGLEIDPKSGKISGTLKDTDQVITIGYLAVGNVTNPNGVSHTGDSATTSAAAARAICRSPCWAAQPVPSRP